MMFPGTISGQRAAWIRSAIILLSCFLPGSVRAQAPPSPVAPPPAAAESAPSKLPPEALNQLLAPIALYPDALVALILPASTVPSDLVLAARYISSNGDPAQIANQPWDDSVKSLARYPDVVKWMDQNLEWTTQVGDAFLNQPADVMNTIQQLRATGNRRGNPCRLSAAKNCEGKRLHSDRSRRTRLDLRASIRSGGCLCAAVRTVPRAGLELWSWFCCRLLAQLRLRLATS